jgi:hypothetical protein
MGWDLIYIFPTPYQEREKYPQEQQIGDQRLAYWGHGLVNGWKVDLCILGTATSGHPIRKAVNATFYDGLL